MCWCIQSGRAIQHVKEYIFTAEGGLRRGIPNVLVVLTDGRSQDDVNKVSKEMQMEGQGRSLSADWRKCLPSNDVSDSSPPVSPPVKATSCLPSGSPTPTTASW